MNTPARKSANQIAALFFERLSINAQFDATQSGGIPNVLRSGWLTEKQTNWLFRTANDERTSARVVCSDYEHDGTLTVDGVTYTWQVNRTKGRASSFMRVWPQFASEPKIATPAPSMRDNLESVDSAKLQEIVAIFSKRDNLIAVEKEMYHAARYILEDRAA